MDRFDAVVLMILGLASLIVLNGSNLLDTYRWEPQSLKYIYAAISFSVLGTGLVVWAFMRFKYIEAIELWKKFQIPK